MIAGDAPTGASVSRRSMRTALRAPAAGERRTGDRTRGLRARLADRKVQGLAAVGLGAALVAGAATYALWSGADVFSGGLLTAGDLDMSTGQATWQQITPGAPSPQSGELTHTPPDFYSMPGDVLQIVQPVSTALGGQNLNAGFSVDFADDQVTADGEEAPVALSFHVEDGDGNQVAPASGEAEIGSVLVMPELTGEDAGRTDDWRVVIRIDVLGEYRWEPTEVTSSPLEWAASSVVVRLQQVRAGTGYATGEEAA